MESLNNRLQRTAVSSKWQPFHSIPLRILFLEFGRALTRRSRACSSASTFNLASMSWSAGRLASNLASIRFLSSSGAVAQLGERLICIQEVAGSIPTSSTSFTQHWACSSVG